VGVAGDPAAVSAGVDGQVLQGTSRLAAYANFVKVAHTAFALPFAVVGLATAARTYSLVWGKVALAVIAFAAARFAAMGFNRIVDRRLDALNPRTAARELPAGRMSMGEATALVTIMSLVFIGASASLNRLCLILSPVALLWILGYSFTKRYTALCHVWLGLSLAIAPVGGYLALAGRWSTPWWLLMLLVTAVACWVAGFDILYSLQDEGFDREHRLYSMTTGFGARVAITVARGLHVVALMSLVGFGVAGLFGAWYWAGVIVAGALLAWEHRLVTPGDYSRLDAAFFTMNGVISAVVMAGTVADVLL
jgi:4-hydroxybenzoate polyprenyltransferase